MKKYFDILKKHFGTHKAAAEALGVSYNRYLVWSWHPTKMPKRSQMLIKLAAESVTLRSKSIL